MRAPSRHAWMGVIAVGMAAVAGTIAAAQRMQWEPNVPYDGRFTFARVQYIVQWGGRSGWEYDYPAMERHLMTMMRETTTLRAHTTGSNIHTLDDPALLKYPVAYLSEPGYWVPSAREAEGLRNYLRKGGFLIVDDFLLNEWANFERSMRQVLPDAQIVPLTLREPIFDWFFRIQSLEMFYPSQRYSNLRAEFYGIYEHNDPSQRLMVIINYNTDLGDYMEWSDQGWWPVNITNDAYKFVMNYILYGLTR